MNNSISNTVKNLYIFTVLLISALPSGILINIPIKIMVFFFLVLLLIFIIYKNEIKISKKLLFIFFFITNILLFFTLYGSLNYGYVAIAEFKLIFITIVLSIMVYIFHIHVFSKKVFFELYSYIVITIFFIKIVGYTYGYLNAGRTDSVEMYHILFDANVISMDLPYGLYRLYSNTDIIPAFYPFVLAWADKEKIVDIRYMHYIVLMASFFVILSSFSRYLFVIFLIGFFILILFKKINIRIFVILLSIVFFIIIVYQDNIIQFIELRIYSHQNSVSDDIRVEQISILLNLYFNSDNVLFGLGIGAYDPAYIRSAKTLFSYENQLLSFLPKTGLIGMLIICLSFLNILYRFFSERNIIGLVSFSLFIFSGWFNPYLYSSNVAILYAFIFLMLDKNVDIQNNRKKTKAICA